MYPQPSVHVSRPSWHSELSAAIALRAPRRSLASLSDTSEIRPSDSSFSLPLIRYLKPSELAAFRRHSLVLALAIAQLARLFAWFSALDLGRRQLYLGGRAALGHLPMHPNTLILKGTSVAEQRFQA